MREDPHNPVDNIGALLRSALIKEADLMETRYWIARLRRLTDLMEQEASRLSDNAIGEPHRVNASLQDGRSLGIQYARGLVLELLRELLALEARQLRS